MHSNLRTFRRASLWSLAACLASSTIAFETRGDDPAPAAAPPAPPPIVLPVAEPTAAAIVPAGVTRGATVEATIQGTNLAGVTGVRVTGDGVVAELAPPPDGKAPNPRQALVRLTAAADARPGFRELRLVGPGGASNVVRFVVSTLPESNEKEPNDLPAAATVVDSLPRIVNGALDRGEDRDCYRFAAKAGSTIVLDLCAQALHPYVANQRPGWLEGFLSVREAPEAGMTDDRPARVLAYAYEFPGREDPLLVFTAPKDGEYVVEVRDDLYRGRPEFNYRLAMGELPVVTAAFPAGGRRGATTETRLEGFHLGSASTRSLTIDAAAPLGLRREPACDGATHDFLWETSDDPEMLEAEPNDLLAAANPATTPVVVNGVIERDGDVDGFKFSATKNQRLIFETTSRAFGSPLDARLELLDASGRRLKEADDANNAFDAALDHVFAADGEYVIRVSDTTGTGSRRHVYRLAVRPPRPDFTLTVSPDNPRVTAGGTIPLRVRVQRRDGFAGPVELAMTDLPPGATASSATIDGAQSEFTVTLTMAPDSAPGTATPTLVGRAKIGEQDVTRTARPAEAVRYVNDWRYVPVNDLALSVLPAAPVTLAWAAPDATVVSGETIQATVHVRRVEGFNAAVRVVLEGLPPRTVAPPVTIAENASEAVVEIRSSKGAPTSLANVVANGSVTWNGATFVQSSPALRLKVDSPPPPEKK